MKVISSSTRVLLAISGVKGVGPATLKKIATLPNFFDLGVEALCAGVPQFGRALGAQDPMVAWQAAQAWMEEQVALAEKHEARIISPIDEAYPRLLAETRDDPFLLYVKGQLSAAPEKSVAIIGTREPTRHGELVAERITQFFVEQKWSVVSGLALGCDSIAHKAAVKAGGHTVAVLAHGLQTIAPSRHKQLAQDILDCGGALVSEYPFGQGVQASQFVKRDKTQAGMAQGVVMVQSDIKGGSLHASRAAIGYERWLAVPYPTPRDCEHQEPKIQANLLIADGRDTERADLLRCPVSALRLVKVVRSRSDYFRLVSQDAATALWESASTSEPLFEDDISGQLAAPADAPAAQESAIQAEVQPAAQAEEKHAEEKLTTAETPLQAQAEGPRVELPTTTSTTYHIVLSPEDWKGLKVSYVDKALPHQDLKARHVFDAAVVVTLFRLRHVQEKLDVLKKLRTSRHFSLEPLAPTVRLQIEDVLTHMSRAADELVELDHGAHYNLRNSVVFRRGAGTNQPELPLQGGESETHKDVPLVDLLHSLVATLPRSIGGGQLEDSSIGSTVVDVSLRDLLHSFNDLVATALPPEAVAVGDSSETEARFSQS
jgi:DNA processing protein